MFSFHKPKIYRSNLGCCICKAKSSSSRFTDSKKYENEFERCFRIEEKRTGEICNACVLLVKRWKKLSPENRLTKHWHHVVDARAGPGTKLSGQRRSGGSYGPSRAVHDQDTSGSSCNQQVSGKRASGGGGSSSNRPDVLPLSSNNQANNQQAPSSGGGVTTKRMMTSINKARAIDTNVSTFTFGEPSHRPRSYMAQESSCFSPTSSSSLSLSKPQSALNSSAFESVIKRFRQRQQQQKLEAQRRQLNRQQRLLNQQQQPRSTDTSKEQLPGQQLSEKLATSSDTSSTDNNQVEGDPSEVLQQQPNKRVKRSSESIGSLSVDGLRVATLLDSSIWRKEKICCGVIFRGLYNEVAVFPKLLKPCQCRLQRLVKPSPIETSQTTTTTTTTTNDKLLMSSNSGEYEEEEEEEEEEEDEEEEEGQYEDEEMLSPAPPPRATKSGSISSCDSNTSGTGSMEQPIEQNKIPASNRKPPSSQQTKGNKQEQQVTASSRSVRQRASKRQPAKRKQPLCTSTTTAADTDSNSSSSVFSSKITAAANSSQQQQVHSPASDFSSGASSSRLLLAADDEFEEDELILDEEDAESNTDSSVESLAELERKNSSGVVGAMG